MAEFLSFFIILFAAVFFSALFNRLHLPWVIALITAGIVIGPQGLELFTPGETMQFLGEIGLIFLMFVAGLETRLSSLRQNIGSVVTLAAFNGIIPAIAGFAIAISFGYGIPTALLLGIIFISTSIAVVIPSMESQGVLHTRLGQVTVGATIINDVASLIFLSIFLQTIDPTTALPLWLHYLLLLAMLMFFRFVTPKIWKLVTVGHHEKDIFQQELRLIIVFLIGTVLIFELLSLHPIIAGFFAGLILSELITSKTLREKIHTISYGIFIPIFFVLVGTRTDFTVFKHATSAIWLTTAIVLGSIVSKFLSGIIASRLARFSPAQSTLIGAATTPALSTTLAVAFSGMELGLLDQGIVTALVLLTVITVILGPSIIAIFAHRTAKLTSIKP